MKKKIATGGRPSQARAEQIGEHILDIATDMFLAQGYGATSIDAVAERAGISKRTFYHRFDDKAAVFAAVVHRLIERLRPADSAQLFTGKTLEKTLLSLAKVMLTAAVSPQVLALQRIIIAEAARFPELATAFAKEGARQEAITGIAALLERETSMKAGNALLAAEQFMYLVVSAPQRRALGIGTAMTQAELDAWATHAVRLFLYGCLKD